MHAALHHPKSLGAHGQLGDAMKTKLLLCLIILVSSGIATARAPLPSLPFTSYLPLVTRPREMLAYATYRDPRPFRSDIAVATAEGLGQLLLTQTSYGEFAEQPAWSPDGTRIAFILWHHFHDPATGASLCVMNADGSAVTCLTSAPEMNRPTWAPDGTRIAFDASEVITSYSALYVINADGSQMKLLASEGGQPAWSPDGNLIAYVGPGGWQNDLYLMNADGTGQHRLADTPFTEMWPAWSPDGFSIAVTGAVFHADGTWTQAAWGESPAWSPDGSRVAYTQWVSMFTSEIHIVNSDGTDVTLPIFGRFPAWKPHAPP